MKKKILFGVIMIVISGLIIIILANLKSSESSKNLLSYWFFHSKSWSCKIVQQEFNEVKKYNYDEGCVERLCEMNNSEYWQLTICKSRAEKGQYNESLKDCVIDYKLISEPAHPETNGQQEKYFYFGIPILKESCPDGYSVQ